MAELVPCLVGLRSSFDLMDPDRPTGSDGWIGDPAHAARKSDHNRDARGLVHAIDITTFPELEAAVQLVVARCRSGAEKRLKYVIFRRRIWSASAGWTERVYNEDDPHTGHAHFSAVSTPARENDTTSWHLEEVPVALTAADKAWIAAEIRKVVTGDADPSDRSYSLGGMVTTIEKRTEGLPERLAAIEAKLAD